MTLKIAKDKFDQVKDYLADRNYEFESRPHQVFLARSAGLVVNLYTNGKIVIAGNDTAERERVEAFLETLHGELVQKNERHYAPIEIFGDRIGTDEAGKGDYFGPLVIAGVLATESQGEMLQKLGVKDSKGLSDSTIQNLAIEIKRLLGENQYDIVVISPIKYNLLLSRMKNLNRLLGWGHARVIENLLQHHPTCRCAISDQFGDRSFIENALMKLGQKIQLIQTPKAEREVTVAAASILAKCESIRRIEAMSESYGIIFPRGATDVIGTAESFVARFGAPALLNVAKVHFKTTDQLSNLSENERKLIRGGKVVMPADGEKTIGRMDNDNLLESYQLIRALKLAFRRYIQAKLKNHYGSNWWAAGIEAHIRSSVEHRYEQERRMGRDVELIDCLEIEDFRAIITDEKNWEQIFKDNFPDKEMVLARFKILKSLNGAVTLSHGRVSEQERLDVIATVRYFMDSISGSDF